MGVDKVASGSTAATHVYGYIYIYIMRERARERERESARARAQDLLKTRTQNGALLALRSAALLGPRRNSPPKTF